MDALEKCLKRTTIRTTLRSLPKSLDDTYARILNNINNEYREDARRALTWLAFSRRPLRLSEIAEAAVLDSVPEFNPDERYQDMRSVLEVLGSLVTISQGGRYHNVSIRDSDLINPFNITDSLNNDNLEGHTYGNSADPCACDWQWNIELAHFSVKEYLMSDRILSGLASDFGTDHDKANALITGASLHCILHYAAEASLGSSGQDPQRGFPLLEYACTYLCEHARSVSLESQNAPGSLILQLFSSKTKMPIWLQALDFYAENKDFGQLEGIEKECLPLLYASEIGSASIVKTLLEAGAPVNEKDSKNETALIAAASWKQLPVMRLLLEYGADIDTRNRNGDTALIILALEGHQEGVSLLLDRDADFNIQGYHGRSALHIAVEKGHTVIVRVLLEHYANANLQDEEGNTVVHLAVWKEDLETLQLLVKYNIDLDLRGSNLKTALILAAQGTQPQMVSLLLQHNASIDVQDINGQTALLQAVKKREPRIVLLLLQHNANVNVQDINGDTALLWAVLKREPQMVSLLLQYNANVALRDSKGNTALYYATQNGCEEVERMLLWHGADMGFSSIEPASENEDTDTVIKETSTGVLQRRRSI